MSRGLLIHKSKILSGFDLNDVIIEQSLLGFFMEGEMMTLESLLF